MISLFVFFLFATITLKSKKSFKKPVFSMLRITNFSLRLLSEIYIFLNMLISFTFTNDL